MVDNPVQFAVVREDPEVELALAESIRARRALLVASGGCTALAFAARMPDVEVELFDINPAQLELVRQKARALASGDRSALDLGRQVPAGLNCCGNFESLFTSLRRFVHDLVAPHGWFERFFNHEPVEAPERALFASRFWPAAFEMHFSDALLEAMFGPDATQYAPRGSYPGYFRRVFERGFTRPDARDNPFLHHVWLGHYIDRPGARPAWLDVPPPAIAPSFRSYLGSLDSVPDLGGYDLVSLSNIFDWTAPENARAQAQRLAKELRPGALVLLRQLNNATDVAPWFGDAFTFDPALEQRLHAADRSLFYDRLRIGRRNEVSLG